MYAQPPQCIWTPTDEGTMNTYLTYSYMCFYIQMVELYTCLLLRVSLLTSFISMGLHKIIYIIIIQYQFLAMLSYILLQFQLLHIANSFFSMDDMQNTCMYTTTMSWFMSGCVHMLYCALLQCQSFYLLGCHIQENSVSCLSSRISGNASYTVSVKRQVEGQPLGHKIHSLQL